MSGIARIGFFDKSSHCSAPSECRHLCCRFTESKSTIWMRSQVFMRKLKSCTLRPTSSLLWLRLAWRVMGKLSAVETPAAAVCPKPLGVPV